MKNKKCPFCEWEISPTAKKCKHCWEWLRKKIKEDNDKTDLWKMIKDFVWEYWIFLIIWGIILYFWLKPSNTQNIIETSSQDIEVENTITEYRLGDNSDNYIIPTEKWYTIFPNSLWECEIQWDDAIKAFVQAIKSTKEGEIIDYTCENNNTIIKKEWSHTTFLFDNSYSVDAYWNIDTSWPQQRIVTIWNYLKNISNLSSLYFTFMFTKKPNDNSEEPDGNLYHFWIDPSKFIVNYVKKWKEKPFYDDKRKNLIFRNIGLNVVLSWGSQSISCIYNGQINWIHEYTCLDVENVYKEIQDIYSNDYNKEEKHTNIILKNITMDGKRFSKWQQDDIYIFTDGEFNVWYERETENLANLKQKYKKQRKHDAWADKTHNLAEFNERNTNRYQKDNKYESFRTEAIDVLRPEIPACEWVNIHVIWITRSTEFKPLAEKIYKQIFEPCEVLFQ